MEGKLNAERQETRDQRGELRMKAYRHGISGKEHDAREQIEGAPEEIHQRGGIANAWRLGEWRRERRSLQSADQVGKTIAKKGAGKEIGGVAQRQVHAGYTRRRTRSRIFACGYNPGQQPICSTKAFVKALKLE